MTDLKPLITEVLPRIRELRHELHAHPEPGYQEFETSRRVASILEEIPGLSLRRNVAVTGLVATLDAERPGPCLALRADMDCLPIAEETGVPYASRRPGLMHACGHDGHTAALVGAALVLAQLRNDLGGPVKFLFQPAEEGGAGARRMVEEGALENPRVEAVFGAHNWPVANLRMGDVALRTGAFMGGSADFFINLRGRGGHAAAPQRAVDPIYVGAQIVNALQSLVSRVADPVDTLVITVGQFHAGSSTNIIPDTARLEGTIRSLSPNLLEEMPDRLRTLVECVAAAHGARAEVKIQPGYPVTMNDARAAELVAEAARESAGAERVRPDYAPVLSSEDFSFYGQDRPACFYFVGARPDNQPDVPFCHNPRYDYNDDVLPLAIAMHARLALRFAQTWMA